MLALTANIDGPCNVKVSNSIIAIGAVGEKGPLYLGHGK